MTRRSFALPAGIVVAFCLGLFDAPAAAERYVGRGGAGSAVTGLRHVTTTKSPTDPVPPAWVQGADRELSLVQLQSGPGWRVRRRSRAWGTPLLVRSLTQALSAHQRRFPWAAPIWIHDASERQGGKLPMHRSHRVGRDVDIRLPLRVPAGYVEATPQLLHVEQTWWLILELVATCDVEFIMLDRELQAVLYRFARRRGIPRSALGLILQFPSRHSHKYPFNGVVRHYPRHRNHMHVRFRRRGQPLEQFSALALCRRPDGAPQATQGLIHRVVATSQRQRLTRRRVARGHVARPATRK